jgi:hypothetical protein
MGLKKTVSIDLTFDCTPPPDGRAWDVADQVMDRINNFIDGEPAGSYANEDFRGGTKKLVVNIQIPVPDIAYAATIETKLENNIGLFPPISNYEKRLIYISQEIADPEDEEE